MRILNSADIFDPVSGNISGSVQMSTPRASLSATTLLDSTVLIAGGNNGTADLASAEIYDPATKAFSITGNLASARSGHMAFLLPNNNEVLIAGGSSSGTALSSAELFVPWVGTFVSTGALTNARFFPAGSALNEDGQLLIAGGTNGGNPLPSGEVFNFATVTTDASDYPPGTTVNISGSGWQPGEMVNLTLVESPLFDSHGPYTALADSNGKIFNNQFATDPNDLNIRFYLTAKGSVSQAQMTFTDANPQTITVSPTNVSVAPGAAANYTVAVAFNGSAGTCTLGMGVTGLPQGASFSPNPIQVSSSNPTTTLHITTTGTTPGGNSTITVTQTSASGTYGGNTATPGTATLIVTAPLLSLAATALRSRSALRDHSR